MISSHDSSDNDEEGDEDITAGGTKSSSSSSSSSAQPTHRRGSASLPVEQYDFDTKITTAVFDSSGHAERKLGITSSSISACINGKRERAGGYGWRRPSAIEAVAITTRTENGHEDNDDNEENEEDDGTDADDNEEGGKPSMSNGQPLVNDAHTHGSASAQGLEGSDSPYLSSVEMEEENDDEEEEEDEEQEEEEEEEEEENGVDEEENDIDEEEEVQEEDGGDDTLFAAAAAALFPPSDADPIPASSSSSSAPTSSSSSSSSSSASNTNDVPPVLMISELRRKALREIIYDRLLNHMYPLTIEERTARFEEFFLLATNIENQLYEDHHPDEYMELFLLPRLCEKLACPSIKAMCP